jgi:cobalamin biosynthesis protein CobD/CbiB
MSAMAGALAVRLEKRDHYSLGQGSPPDGADTILHAVRLARASAALALLAYALGSLIWRAHAAAR